MFSLKKTLLIDISLVFSEKNKTAVLFNASGNSSKRNQMKQQQPLLQVNAHTACLNLDRQKGG